MFGGSGIRLVSIIVGVLFVLGLIVLANRFGGQIRERLQTRVATTTVTPSPSPSPVQTANTTPPTSFGEVAGQNDQTKGGLTYQGNQVSQTPDTGAEILVIPGLITLFGVGLKLRKSA